MFRRAPWTWPPGPVIKNAVPIAAIVLGVSVASGGSVAVHVFDQNDIAFSQDDFDKLLATGACEKCDLGQAQLRDADLQEANLQGANLKGADLKLVDLREANLKGADLRGAQLERADLSGAIFWVRS